MEGRCRRWESRGDDGASGRTRRDSGCRMRGCEMSGCERSGGGGRRRRSRSRRVAGGHGRGAWAGGNAGQRATSGLASSSSRTTTLLVGLLFPGGEGLYRSPLTSSSTYPSPPAKAAIFNPSASKRATQRRHLRGRKKDVNGVSKRGGCKWTGRVGAMYHSRLRGKRGR